MGMVREQACQRALTRERTLWGGSALERGHGAPLETLAQLGDALCGVGAVAREEVDAAELVSEQTAKEGGIVSMGADRKANASGAAAHSRLVILVSLRMAASTEAPLAPMWFSRRLRARGGGGAWLESQHVNGR